MFPNHKCKFFFDTQGYTRVFVPRIAGQEGVHMGTSQTETRGERSASEKGPFMIGKHRRE